MKTAERADSALLKGLVEAEYLLRRRQTSQQTKAAWLARYADHPQASAIFAKAGAPEDIADIQDETFEMEPIERTASPSTGPDPDGHARTLRGAVWPHLRRDDPAVAEAAWLEQMRRADVPGWASAYYAYRIAWDYYLAGNDTAAQRMGELGGAASERQAALCQWVAGLAAWRQGDYATAYGHFAAINAKPDLSPAMRAAGYYWAARAAFVNGHPDRISAYLTEARRYPETFYGLLAIRTLGFNPSFDWYPPGFIHADWNQLSDVPAVRRAVALVQIGRSDWADRELRYLWGRTDPQHYDALVRLAALLNLPRTQHWLAHRPPKGQAPSMSGRYPTPQWAPETGWRVDPALVFGITLQESRFSSTARSRAGAQGLMQIMPATVRHLKRNPHVRGNGNVTDPAFNLEMGQTYLEELRDTPATGGLLTKILAAYNAGPGNLQRWNSSLNDADDPLLFMESIPFSETRHYVEKVMTNYWLYSLKRRETNTSLDAMAANLWARFPGMPGPAGVPSGRPSVEMVIHRQEPPIAR